MRGREGDAFLDGARREFRRLEELAGRALDQIDDAAYFRTLDDDGNSIAVLVKHLAGNMRSRWTDFLTTDGEKPDRDRDSEFVITGRDDRATLTERAAAGWRCLEAALAPLGTPDLERTVTIRGEPHTVLEAVSRQLTHYGYHVGQIVLLARHWAGDRWQTLSVPRGGSRAFNRAPEAYLGAEDGSQARDAGRHAIVDGKPTDDPPDAAGRARGRRR
ncbi:MAG: DUF1572 family protein [Candidatus Eiseniibacteriota bacterium]|jgi:hypothetical protein